MNYLKPCKNCSSLERYKNGACKPCAVKKQLIRNRSYVLPIHLEIQNRTIENNRIKKLAKENGDIYYISLTPCERCGEKIRYVCNGACSECNT